MLIDVLESRSKNTGLVVAVHHWNCNENQHQRHLNQQVKVARVMY